MLTTIADNPMATRLATGVQADEAPERVSFALFDRPDFMTASFLTA